MKKYGVILSDPPWPSRDKLPGQGRGAVKHYRLMTLTEIASYLEKNGIQVTEDVVLFLWRVAHQGDAVYHVMSHWGFTPKSEIVWKKLTSKGNRHFGMGSYVRMEHEVCKIGVRGSPTRKAANVRSIFEAPVRQHSRKPEEIYKIIESLYDGPYLELFSRSNRPGWDAMGDEVGKFDAK